jgi:hypothetical protein
MQEYRAKWPKQEYDHNPSAQHRSLVWQLVNALFGQDEEHFTPKKLLQSEQQREQRDLEWLPVEMCRSGDTIALDSNDGSDLLARRAMVRAWFDDAVRVRHDQQETPASQLEHIFYLLTIGELGEVSATVDDESDGDL